MEQPPRQGKLGVGTCLYAARPVGLAMAGAAEATITPRI
jgi:hypothetical protein